MYQRILSEVLKNIENAERAWPLYQRRHVQNHTEDISGDAHATNPLEEKDCNNSRSRANYNCLHSFYLFVIVPPLSYRQCHLQQ